MTERKPGWSEQARVEGRGDEQLPRGLDLDAPLRAQLIARAGIRRQIARQRALVGASGPGSQQRAEPAQSGGGAWSPLGRARS